MAILGRALRTTSPEDGRAAIAFARALPEEVEARPSDSVRARATRAREALDVFIEAAPEAPETAGARRLRAWAMALGGDLPAAIARAAGEGGLQDRAGAELLRRLALAAVLQGRLAAARVALVAAHRSYPQSNEVLNELGAVELALGAPGAAAERFARVLGRRPSDLDARRDLAGALVAAGRPEAAVELLVPAVAQHPEVHALWLELAYAALEAGASRAAEEAARSAIEHLPDDDARGHAALGLALTACGRREEARAAFEEALRRDPDDLRASQGLNTLDAPPPRAERSLARALAAP